MHWNRLKKGKRGVLYEKKEEGKGRGEQAPFFPTFTKLEVHFFSTKKHILEKGPQLRYGQ